jgi:hypothetical protein
VGDYSEMILDLKQRLESLHLMCLNKRWTGYQEEIANMNDSIYCLQQWIQHEAKKAA